MSAVCPQPDLIQTVSLPDDPPRTIQKPHIDLYLTHQKKHLGDDCMFQSLFAELKAVILIIGLYILMDQRQKIGLLQLLHLMASVPR